MKPNCVCENFRFAIIVTMWFTKIKKKVQIHTYTIYKYPCGSDSLIYDLQDRLSGLNNITRFYIYLIYFPGIFRNYVVLHFHGFQDEQAFSSLDLVAFFRQKLHYASRHRAFYNVSFGLFCFGSDRCCFWFHYCSEFAKS